MSTITEYTMNVFKTVPHSDTAKAGGRIVTLPAGVVSVIVRPSGGNITVKVEGFTPTIAVADGYYSPVIGFEPDGSTAHTITLVGANVTTEVVANICSSICATTTITGADA